MKYFAGACVAVALLAAATNASAATRILTASLNGAQQVPPNGSAGTGQCTVTLDDVTGNVSVSACTFTGLSSNAFVAHIHGLAGFGEDNGILITLTVPSATSGTVTGSGVLSAPNVAGMLAGQTYLNIHSFNFGNGEIRGQILTPAPSVPWWGLSLLAFLLAGAGGLLLARRRVTVA
jgi:CHRD domain